MSDSITITQATNKVTVTAQGSVGLNAGGQIDGNLEVTGTVAVGGNQLGKDVRFWGETANKYFLWDASQDKVIITGDLQVDGTTTTINSTVVSIADPVFSLGGTSVPTSSDSKDRGIEHFYYDTSAGAGKRGFFGWSNADNAYKFLTDCPDPSGAEIFTGTAGNLLTGNITADSASSSGHISIARNGLNRLKSMLANNDGGWQYEGSSGNVFYAGASGNDYVIRDGSFSTSGDLRFIVSQSGNVGIGGVTSPSAKLHIEASGTSNARTLLLNSVGSGSTGMKIVGASGSISVGDNLNQTQIIAFDTANKALKYQQRGTGGGGNAFPAHQFTGDANSSGVYPAILGAKGGAAGAALFIGQQADDTTVFTVEYDGKVGIGGVTAPAAALHVKDSTQAFIRVESGGSDTAGIELNSSGTVQQALQLDSANNLVLRNTAGTHSGDIYFDYEDSVFFRAGGATTALTILNNQNVGIGTTSPASILHVEGATPTVTINGTSSTGPTVQLSGTYTNWTIENQYTNGANNDMFRIRNSALSADALVINRGNNNVGINNSNPTKTLDITGGIRWTGNSSALGNITFNDNVRALFGNSTDLQIYHSGHNRIIAYNGDLRFSTNGTERLRIEDTTGLVRVFGDLQVDGTTTTVNSTVVTIDDPVLTLGGDTAPSSDDNKDRGIEFRYYDGSAKIGFMGWDDSAGRFTLLKDATNSSEVFSGTAANLNLGFLFASNVYTPFVRSNAASDTFIKLDGTSDMTFNLHANATHYAFQAGGSEKVRIATDGNVGIGGITAPAAKVHILNGTANDPHIRLSDPNSSSTNDATGYLEVYHGNTNGRAGYFGMITNAEMALATTTSSGNFRVYTGNNQAALSIDNSQNVGIGTTVPSQKLEVAGNIRTSGNNSSISITDNGSDAQRLLLSNNSGTSTANSIGGSLVLEVNSTEFLRFDSAAINTKAYKNIRFSDNVISEFGTSGDFRIFHDGSNSYLEQKNAGTGNIVISNANDAADIVLQTDNGSGGVTPYLTIDGGNERVTVSKPIVQAVGTIDPVSNGDLTFTAVSDTSLKIKYKGSDGSIRSTTLTLS